MLKSNFAAALTILALLTCTQARAERWPTLEDYLSRCVLIVKAKTVAEGNGNTVIFRVQESWMGQYDPKLLARTKDDGRFVTYKGEHGVNVVDGQEIVFFFTRHNNPKTGPLRSHSTAFPITDGKLTYGATANPSTDPEHSIRKEYTVTAFKQRIEAIIKAQDAAKARQTTKPTKE